MKKQTKKILGVVFIFLFVHTTGVIAKDQKELSNQFRPDKVYSMPELAGSGPSTKQVGVETVVSDRTQKLPSGFNVVSQSRSTSLKTWPEMKSEIDAARRTLSDVTIYSGTYNQYAPQVAIDGNEIFVAFEDADTHEGTYPYGLIKVYRSDDNGISWIFWQGVFHSYYPLSSPQIVIACGYVIVSYRIGGYLSTARWRLSDGAFSTSNISTPVADNTNYVVSYRMVSDAEKFPISTWLYMAYIFKQADGSNAVLFSISKDTANSWTTYDSLGFSRAELGSASIGLDYGESGLYLTYLGTGANAGQIILRKSTNLGKTWTSEQIFPITQYGGTNLKVGLSVAAVGQRVAIVYQYDFSGNATDWKTSDDFDIYAVVSTDGGTLWMERAVGSSRRNEILPWITHDANGNMYVSFIKDEKVRVSMAGDEMKFSTPDSASSANASLDYSTSICGSGVTGVNKAYTTWTGILDDLDIFGSSITLQIPPLSPSSLSANVISPIEIDLTWSDNSNDEKGFQIYWSEGTTDSYTLHAIVGPGISSYKCTGLMPSTAYSFIVTAYNDNGSSLGTKPADATTPSPPATLMVTTTIPFPKKTKASDYSASDYRIIGLPGASNIDIGSILAGTQDTDWQVYWDDGTNMEDSLKAYNSGSGFRFSSGRAFWVISRNDFTINRSVNAAPLNAAYEVEIPLHTGWNLITNPFTSTITWSKIQNANAITSNIFTFTNGSFSHSTNFDPYVGYYFFNGTPGTTLSVLKVPYREIFAKISGIDEVEEEGWRVNVELSSDGVIDGDTQFGVSESANPGLDIYDVRKPRAVGPIPEVYFERKEWDNKYPAFFADIKSPVNELEQWTFTVKSEPGKQVSLTFKGIAGVPRQSEIYLVDNARAEYKDLREDSVYTFVPVVHRSEFSVYVGKKDAVLKKAMEVVPMEFSLGQNFPNPFNPKTSFSVRLPVNSSVTVTVFNILGQLVQSVYSGNLEAGQHWFTWDGRNEDQKSVPSGIYYCRLDVSGVKSFVTKMVMLK